MKKKLIIGLATVMVAGMLAGCGSDGSNSENSQSTVESGAENTSAGEEIPRVNVSELNTADYVTLGEYKNLSVVVAPITVTDDDVKAQSLSIYQGSVTAENGGVTDRAVAIGDTVIIDYEGKKDGVAFSGGTAQGADLTIGSGQFIDGFEDGLIGVMPGETVDLNLTFPENYDNTELAGAKVVFTVTVNYILPVEMMDDVVAGFGSEEYQNVEQLNAYVRTALEEDAQYTYEQNVQAAFVNAMVQNCTYQELPEALVAQYEASITENMQMMAAMYGMDADTLVYYFYGTDLATYASEGGKASAQQILAAQAVAEKEGLVLEEDALKERIETLAAENGWSSAEELLAQYDQEELRESLMFQDVLDYLVENGTVTAE
ncbi:MAG: trigger factor [Lachnospiraceae bacterium]|nr:trigger factor [Lachnospiraceae bacterium]